MSTKQEFINSLELHSEVVHQKNAEIADLKRQLEEANEHCYDVESGEVYLTLKAEIADLKRQLAKVESQRDFWYEACQEDELSKLNDEIDDLKRQLAESVQRQEALEAVVALDKQQLTALREQNAKLRDGLAAIGLAAGEQKRRGEAIVHDAIIDVVKFALRETSDESEAKDE